MSKESQEMKEECPIDVAIQFVLEAVDLLHTTKDVDVDLEVKIEFSGTVWNIKIEDGSDVLEEAEGPTLSKAITTLVNDLTPKVKDLEKKLEGISLKRVKLLEYMGI